MSENYICSSCGMEHPGIPFSFAADYPDNYANMNPDERDTRTIIGSDQCVIDSEQFYLRGCLEIPIHGQDDPFLWGLWAILKEDDYDTIADCWETPGRENRIGPFKGRLGNALSLYTDAFNLRLAVRIQPVGIRSLLFVEEPDHPLALEQREGISLETARRYSCLMMRI